MKGIDVSTYQGYPDWRRVKASGVDFAIIKAGQGRAESSSSYLFTDSKFKYNITNATAAGIPCGTYYYFTARNASEALKEARHFIEIMSPYKHLITLYAAVDVESKHLAGLSKWQLTNLVTIFCDEVKAAGYTPIVYTNPDWLKNRLDGTGGYDLWLALWRDKMKVPTSYGMKIWQWGASRVDGIIGDVDSNFGYFDLGGSVPVQAAPTPAPASVPVPAPSERDKIKAGDKVRVENPVNYDTGKRFALYYATYDVIQVKGDRAVIGRGKTVTAAVHIDYIERV